MDGLVAKATVLIWITHLLCSTDARGPPRLNTDAYQKRRLVRVGDNLKLSCLVEASPPPLFTWTKDGHAVHIGWDRYRLNGDLLRVREADIADSGVYVCRATNGFGTLDVKYLVYVYADSNDTTLPPDDFDEDIFHPVSKDAAPQFVADDQLVPGFRLSPVAGSTVRLQCRAIASPPPEITWYKDGIALSPDRGTAAADDARDVLLLPEVTSADSGRYECRVQNRAGTIKRSYDVSVDADSETDGHVILHPFPQNVTRNPGGDATFQCHIRSDTSEQAPNVQWLKRVDSAQDVARFSNATVVSHGSDQFVVLPSTQPVHRPSMSGVDTTRTSGPGTPVVAGRVQIRSEPRSDGTLVSRLTINDVQVVDVGLYVCVVVGRHGSRSYRTASLTVGAVGGDESDDVSSSNAAPVDPFYTPVVAAVVAISVIVVLAVLGCVIYHRRSTKKSPAGSSARSAALLSTNGTVTRHNGNGFGSTVSSSHGDRRPSPSPQHQAQQQQLHHQYSGGGAGTGTYHLTEQPTPHYHYTGLGPQPSVSGGTPSTSGGSGSRQGNVACRDPIVRSTLAADSSCNSDYSSIARTSAMPGVPHLHPLQPQPQQQQQQMGYNVMPLYQARYREYEAC